MSNKKSQSILEKIKKSLLDNNKFFGLYLHLPFCEGKCRYCDFYSENYSPDRMDNYLSSLKQEIRIYSSLLGSDHLNPYNRLKISNQSRNSLEGNDGIADLATDNVLNVETIYIGGGTPGLLAVDQLAEILDLIRGSFAYLSNLEITIEANPYSLTEEKIAGYKGLGVNRLSLGVQSFNDKELSFLGRKHTSGEAVETINIIDSYFNNYNIDLIFAIPGQKISDWQNTLEKAINLNPNHISLYNLQIEEGTPLAVSLDAGEFEEIDNNIDAEMYLLARDMLVDSGYQHYEISNFARPDFQSRHNRLYWELKPYLGLGPAAHSFTGLFRYNNYSNINKYNDLLFESTQNLNAKSNYLDGKKYLAINEQIEILSDNFNSSIDYLPLENIMELRKEDLMAERLFMGLRLLEGVSLEVFYEEFEIRLEEYYHQEIKNLKALGLIEFNNHRMKLTKKGILHGNRVFMEFLP